MFARLARFARALPGMLRLSRQLIVTAVIRIYMLSFWAQRGVLIASTARLFYPRHQSMALQAGCFVGHFTILIAIETPGCGEDPLLQIGERTYVGDQCNLRAAGGKITLGNDCLIGNGVTIVASNHGIVAGQLIRPQPWLRADVVIEDDVWLGAGVTVLPGAHIGRGAVIAAGAVVRGHVPPNAIFSGVPARLLRMRS